MSKEGFWKAFEGLRKALRKAFERPWKGLGRTLEGLRKALGEGLREVLEECWKVLGRSSEDLGEDLPKTLEDPSKDLRSFVKPFKAFRNTFQDPSKTLPRP